MRRLGEHVEVSARHALHHLRALMQAKVGKSLVAREQPVAVHFTKEEIHDLGTRLPTLVLGQGQGHVSDTVDRIKAVDTLYRETNGRAAQFGGEKVGRLGLALSILQ